MTNDGIVDLRVVFNTAVLIVMVRFYHGRISVDDIKTIVFALHDEIYRDEV